MKMYLVRDLFNDVCTLGRLSIGLIQECYTLEDVVREIKVPGKTAIPYGTYEIIINFSNRFQRPMPLLLNVPGFDGVRIHKGNTAKDTEGCILVGNSRGTNSIQESAVAFDRLFPKIEKALQTGKVYIEVLRP
jgi:hypothetical protein